MKLFLFLFLILCSSSGLSQQKKLDSLLAVNAGYKKEDSVKVVYLTQIFRQYSRLNDLDKMEEFAIKALVVAKKLPQTFSQTYIYERLGLCYHGKAKYLQAIEAYNNGIAIANKRNDKGVMADFYLNLGALYGTIPDYDKSLEANQQAVHLYNETGDKEQISNCYMNIGLIYNEVKNPVKAIEYIQKALAIFKTFNEGLNYGVSVAYEGIASSYLIASDIDLIKLGISPAEKFGECLGNLNNALKIAETAEDAMPLIGPIQTDIGNIYARMGDHTLALHHFQIAYEAIKKSENKDDLGNILFTLGKFYADASEYTKSKMYLYQSLAVGKETGLLLMQQKALEKLSVVYEKAKRFDSALIFYQQSIIVKDSVFGREKEKEITRKQLQLDFAIKENEYKLIQQVADSKLNQQELQIGSDKKIKIFLAIAIALALVIGGLIYYDRRKTKKLNTIIGEQKNIVEQLSNVKDKMFSVVSHDMRAPVNSLLSFINILEDGNIAPEKLSLYAKDLKQNLSYTSALMNNLLNWAASQMQGFKPVNENFDLAALTTDVVNTLQHHHQQKNITILNTIAASTTINTDRNMMAAILRNLISNAIKYSYKESIITVSATNTTSGYTIITVKDEGIGMDATQTATFNTSHQQHIESTRGTDNEKGTGLGLLLSKTFAEQMGGKITAENDDKGMIFKIWLPAN